MNEDGSGIADRGYWLTPGEYAHCFDGRLCEVLAALFCGKSVLDLGCGPGWYVSGLKSYARDVEGYDGNPHTKAPDCHVLDLSRPIDLGRPFDWVLSLEVGEHIPREFERTFIDNVRHHAREGVVLSWAVEGQGGHGHVNERSNDYIKGVFRDLGFANDLAEEGRLRDASELPWFRNTLMVFRR